MRENDDCVNVTMIIASMKRNDCVKRQKIKKNKSFMTITQLSKYALIIRLFFDVTGCIMTLST